MKIQLGDEFLLDGRNAKVVGETPDGELRIEMMGGKYLICDPKRLEFIGSPEFRLK